MSKNNKPYIIITVLALIFLFITAAMCDRCATITKEEIDIKEEEEVEEASEEDKEAPTIELEVYEGPTLEGSICYWKVKAVITGDPTPDIDWNKDNSLGSLGNTIARINLYDPSETYTLIATATNSEGSDEASIDLSWGCNSQDTAGGKTNSYSKEELEYFFEIAFGSEYGTSQPIIHKWTNNIRIKINGTPTNKDLDSLNQVIAELNSLLSGISLDIVTYNQNIDIYFTAVDQFASILPGYIPGNMGYFTVWWDSSDAIYKAKILIAIDDVSQQERSHLIREELTQSLGIMKDSYRYKDSVFYQGWTDTLNYSPIDRTIVSLLYDPRLRSGMTQEQIISLLSTP